MKTKSKYKCSACGHVSAGFFSKCPGCGAWNTLTEEVTGPAKKGAPKRRARRLIDVPEVEKNRFITSSQEFNRVMGGGILEDSVTILAAKPGAGKSTLLFQIANDLALQGKRVLYASGEESESQIRGRAQRIAGEISPEVYIYGGNSMDDVLEGIREVDPELIILDSIQTFTLAAFPARAGAPTQTMECANALVEVAKDPQRPRAVFLVGQLTKSDSLAGVRALEHLVDTVLFIDQEAGEELRLLTATKNRFGSTGEMGFFKMGERGMASIEDPSFYFTTKRGPGEEVPGSAKALIREGSRLVVVEVESLVARSNTPYPQRISECFRREKLEILISILQERAKVSLYERNVILKTTGGISLRESAANLAAIMSIASSVRGRALAGGAIFIGDVGLTGELKAVPYMEGRIKEALRMGFGPVVVPQGHGDGEKVLAYNHINELLQDLL
ncbi:MAG: AAA family ATPase [Tissierellia bacterium]|nr:AAA family ATPase [Tissierellia bacterium]